MRATSEAVPFLLLLVGTLGLLLNEFVFDWGRVATLGFGGSNVVGLLGLAWTSWSRKRN